MSETNEDKKIPSIDGLLKELKTKFGDSCICRVGSSDRMTDVKVRSSGSISLDIALGGGYPHGRIIELAGKERSGKTCLANLAIAEAQLVEPDKENAIIDLENAYNLEWASKLGVDASRLFISQPDTYAENVYAMVEMMVASGKFAFIVLDSVAGLITKDEYEQEDWDKEPRIGGASKLNSRAMRKLVNSGLLTKSGTTLLFINQLRDAIGQFSPFGTPTTTNGGRSLKHAYSQILDVSMGEQFTKGNGTSKEVLGQKIKVKVSKNKIAPPYKHTELDLYFDSGVDKIFELTSVAKILGILQGTSWLKFINPVTGEIYLDEDGKEYKFNGLVKTIEFMKEDVKLNGGKLYNDMFNVVNQVIRG
jgi:recombination protein RecA